MNAVNEIKPYKLLDGALGFLVARGVPAGKGRARPMVPDLRSSLALKRGPCKLRLGGDVRSTNPTSFVTLVLAVSTGSQSSEVWRGSRCLPNRTFVCSRGTPRPSGAWTGHPTKV